MENGIGFPQKMKNRTNVRFSNLISEHIKFNFQLLKKNSGYMNSLKKDTITQTGLIHSGAI